MVSLRIKVELALFLVLGLVVGLSYGIQRLLILPTLSEFEERTAWTHLTDGIAALDLQADAIEDLTKRLADDPYIRGYFEQDEPSREQNSVIQETLAEANVEFMGLINDGEVVRVWTKRRPVDADALYASILDAAIELQENDAISGLATLANGPAMLSAKRSPTLVESSVNATLVLGRPLNRESLDIVYFDDSILLQSWPLSTDSLPREQQSVFAEFMGDERIRRLTRMSDTVISVYTIMKTAGGENALLIRSDVNRSIAGRTYDSIMYGLLIQAGAGLTALFVLIQLFRSNVMKPLDALTEHATSIAATNDLDRRIHLDRDDEFGVLGNEFDDMVARLQRDISAREKTERRLHASEDRYLRAVNGANDGIWDWNLVSNEVYYSTRWKGIAGLSEDDSMTGSPDEWFCRIHPDDVENVRAAIDTHIAGRSSHFESEHRMIRKDGKEIWVLCRGLAVVEEDGKRPVRMAGSLSDITLRKDYEDQLKHQSLHDSLTALPNRALLLDRVTQALRRARREDDTLFALVFLDLDRFKVINDSLGHAVGDKLLSSVAERLLGALRDGDTITRAGSTVARFGGDEFILLLDDLHSSAAVVKVAERIQDLFRAPFSIEGHEIYTAASIGIVVNEDDETTAEEMIRNADTAMYRAKGSTKSSYEIFNIDMHTEAVSRMQLENDLRKAVEREELEVYYQPIVSLTTGRITAFEALIRWQHPELGFISPEKFVPVAEETGLIVPLGQFIMGSACDQAREWQNTIPEAAELGISVNLSPKEFSNTELLKGIELILKQSKLDSSFLKLEITESSLMDSIELISRILNQIRSLGAQLSIDDFGTGYSSLSHLHRFPMNNLKIDQAFVREMHNSNESMQIIKTIALLAHALEMNIIAEGIEEESHIRALQELDCHYGQGYYFSRPVDAAGATALLKNQPDWIPWVRAEV